MSVQRVARSEPGSIPFPDGGAAAKVMAVLRIATGAVFLWAFFDKLFGLGYATPFARAWLVGGSPTLGYLSRVDVGPFASPLRAIAGAWWANWLFMLGLAGIGAAVLLGVGLRVAAVAGVVMMLLMWVAEWPLAQVTAAGTPSGSTNPLIDYHVIYALVLIALAVTHAGRTWGLGRVWESRELVRRHGWLA